VVANGGILASQNDETSALGHLATVPAKAILLAIGLFAIGTVVLPYRYLAGDLPGLAPIDTLLLAILLRAGKNAVLPYAVAVIPAGLLAFVVAGEPLTSGIGVVVSILLGAVPAALLLRRKMAARIRMATMNEFFWFLFVGAVFGQALSAFGRAVTFHFATAAPVGPTWLNWWVTGAVETALLGPLILSFDRDAIAFLRSFPKMLEAIALIALSVIAGMLIFSQEQFRVLFLVAPVLLWAALRFDFFVTTLCGTVIAAIAVWYTYAGLGPFNAAEIILPTGPFGLQFYLSVAILPVLLVALLISERSAALAANKQSRQRFQNFADSASDWFWETGPDLSISYVSGRFTEQIGLDPDNIIGRLPWQVAADSESSAWAAQRARLERHEPFREFECQLTDGHGRRRVIRSSGVPIFDADRKFLGYRGADRDSTELEQTERALSQKSMLLESVLQCLDQGVIVVDADLRVAAWNLRFRDLLDVPTELLAIGTPFERIARAIAERGEYGAGDVETLVQQRVAMVKERQVHSFMRTRPNGTVLDARGRRLPDGGFVTTYTDISRLKLAMEELSTRESRIRGIMESTVDGVVTIDESGTINSVNRSTLDMFGYEEEEIVGQNVRMLMPEPYRTEHDTYIRNYLATGIKKVIGLGREVEALRKDRTIFPVDLFISELRPQDGKRQFMGTLRDLTERKALEAQYIQAQKMEAVGQLTGGLSHDFNNLLAVIMGNLELLGEAITDRSELQGYLRAALRSTERGAELTQRLLAFSRRQALRPEPTDLNALVSGTTEMLRRTLGETIQIRTILAAGLWKAMVDPSQLETALLNLSLNARDAMPKGGKLTIETANTLIDEDYAFGHDEVSPGRYVLLAVSDTGEGIPPELFNKVFEPFFTTKDLGKGSGLGLSMVYGFVKQSNGHVKIYSEVGQGTLVKLYLPKALEGEAEVAKRPTIGADPRGKGEQILVVEDDPDVQGLAVVLLTNLGYKVLRAEDGVSALRTLEEADHVDLLLTDVVLPRGMSGVQLAQEAQRRVPALKVLYMSGYMENAIVHHGVLDEGIQLIAKPFRKIELARKVRQILDG